jgi:hypothetical protein
MPASQVINQMELPSAEPAQITATNIVYYAAAAAIVIVAASIAISLLRRKH